MENREASADNPKSTDSALQNLLNRVFRCRHRRKTFPFTPRGEDQCYAVCLDCGQRLGADLHEIGTALPSEKASLPKPSSAPSPSQAERSRASAPDFGLRNWKFDLLWVGLFVVGLSGGLYLTDRIRQSALQRAVPENRLSPAACSDMQTVSLRSGGAAPSIPKAVAETRAAAPSVPKAVAETRAAAPVPPPVRKSAPADGAESRQVTSRLVSKSSVAVLGLEAAAVAELSEHPGRLGDLIQSGSLFTVPSGTPIRVLETENGVLKVEILEGSMAGRAGWARPSQVMPRYRLPDQARNRELRQLGEH